MASCTRAHEGLPKLVGFIGLGAMGKPMATNLAKMLPPGSQMFVHDVVDAPVQESFMSFPDTVVRCASAKEVADKSVSSWAQSAAERCPCP